MTWGSAAVAIAWPVMSLLFSWYAAHFGSYNKTYGALGAIIGFMTWIAERVTCRVVNAIPPGHRPGPGK